MALETTRICCCCNIEKPLKSFEYNKKLKNFRRRCHACLYLKRKDTSKYQERQERIKQERLSPEYRAKFIFREMKYTDKKRGWESPDVSMEWIDEQISKPCSYCKQHLSKNYMTMDRIDNNLGHFKNNLMPSCHRCNYFRGNMPYKAWIVLAENMPKIVNLGLLDGWQVTSGMWKQ